MLLMPLPRYSDVFSSASSRTSRCGKGKLRPAALTITSAPLQGAQHAGTNADAAYPPLQVPDLNRIPHMNGPLEQ
jgi:hypothetical protein